jgi:hypothetical protein
MPKTILVLALVLGLASSVAAEKRDYSIALHVQDYYMDCETRLDNCWAINTYFPTMEIELYIYVMICGHGWAPGSDGFTAASYGITWPQGWTFLNWTACADWTVGTIQNPGDCVQQHWLTCVPPSGWPVTVGILQLIPTSPGQVLITTHSTLGQARVDDCHGTSDVVLPCNIGNGRAGWVTIVGPDAGCNPCPCVGPPCYLPPSGTEPGSWGMIKALYR